MCYSAQVKADYRKLVRTYGAIMSLDDFAKLYFHDPGKARPKTPKAMDDAFAEWTNTAEHDIWRDIVAWRGEEATSLEKELFAQKTRLNGAQRAPQRLPARGSPQDVSPSKQPAHICTVRVPWARGEVTWVLVLRGTLPPPRR